MNCYYSGHVDLEGAKRLLIRHLEELIAWRSCFGSKDISLCASVEPHQHEVQRILDANPELSGEAAITEQIERARHALMKRMRLRAEEEALLSSEAPPERLYVPRPYALAELLKPPLTAFGPPGIVWMQPDFGEWEELDLASFTDSETVREALARGGLDWDWVMWGAWALEALDAVRLGKLFGVWRLWVPDKPQEYIEHWGAEFWRPEEQQSDRYREAECYYRYSFDDPQHGVVYPRIKDALCGEGGVPLSAALADGLSDGLVLPYAE
jgi:hypothetical protein